MFWLRFFCDFVLFLFVYRESVVSRLSLISIEAGVGVDLKKVSTAVVRTKIVRSNVVVVYANVVRTSMCAIIFHHTFVFSDCFYLSLHRSFFLAFLN